MDWIINLLNACERGAVDEVKELTSCGHQVNTPATKYLRKPLHVAVEHGHKDVFNVLLSVGADPELPNCDETSPLLLACHKGDSRLIRKLLEMGVQVNTPNKYGEVPLIIACQNCDISVVNNILQHGVSKNAIEPAVLVAARRGRVDIKNALLDSIAEMKYVIKICTTALGTACLNGHVDVVQSLLNRGAEVSSPDKSDSPFWLAVDSGCSDVVRLLLECGCDVNACPNDGLRAIFRAYSRGNVSLMRLLLKFDAEIPPQNPKGITPLHIAAAFGDINWMKSILQNGSTDLEIPDCCDGSTALHNAVKFGHSATVEALLSHGADINVSCHESLDTALHVATRRRNCTIIDILLQHKADVTKANRTGLTPVHIAATNGDQNIVERYLESLLPLPSVLRMECLRNTVSMAARSGNLDLMKTLLEYGAPVDSIERTRETFLECLDEGHVSIVNFILDRYDMQVDIPKHFSNPSYDFARICSRGDSKHLARLAELGVDFDLQVGIHGRSAVHVCAVNGYSNTAAVLLKLGVSVDRKDKQGRTALMSAALNGHVRITDMLLSEGADVNAVDNNGMNVLHHTVYRGNLRILRLLTDRVPTNLHNVTNKGETPLHIACQRGNLYCVLDLLSKGAEPNAIDQMGRNPLGSICNNIFEVSCTKRNVSSNQVAKRETAGLEVIEALLCAGCDPKHEDNYSVTPLLTLIKKKLGLGWRQPSDTTVSFDLYRDDVSKATFDLLQDAGFTNGIFRYIFELHPDTRPSREALAYIIRAGCGAESSVNPNVLYRVLSDNDIGNFELLHQCCYSFDINMPKIMGENMPQLQSRLQEFLAVYRNPPTLREMTRFVIRALIRDSHRGCLSIAVCGLPIPESLKSFLLFKQ